MSDAVKADTVRDTGRQLLGQMLRHRCARQTNRPESQRQVVKMTEVIALKGTLRNQLRFEHVRKLVLLGAPYGAHLRLGVCAMVPYSSPGFATTGRNLQRRRLVGR